MEYFEPIMQQMIFLFALILIGYLLMKIKLIPENSETVLSKLENYLFVPALTMGTFIKHCNVDMLKESWRYLSVSAGLLIVLIPLSIFVAKVCFQTKYLRKIATYALTFSNFAFMGNAIILGVFKEEVFADYLIFTLPFWVGIYLWGAPVLLIGDDSGNKKGFGARMKSFLNPMLIAMFIGIVIGLLQWTVPAPVMKVITVSGDCMSPIAMLLTGMTIGKLNLLKLITKWRLYLLSFFKLLVYPLLFIAVFAFVPHNSFFNETTLICMMCIMSMPTGLNTIVLPAAYGKDTSDAAGMALITHALSVITIPLMFMLFKTVVL